VVVLLNRVAVHVVSYMSFVMVVEPLCGSYYNPAEWWG